MKKREKKEIIEKIDQTFEVKQKVPKNQKEKIYKEIFQDVLLSIVIVTYYIFLNLGYKNIKGTIFLTDLKVFSISTVFASIILFEYSYKKNNGKIAIYGIEVLILAISTLASIYLLDIWKEEFPIVISAFSSLFCIYYLIKFHFIYRRMKKEYYESLSDIKEIVKKKRKTQNND